jgi:proteasome lid subunit RPN8/RPN11
MTALSQPPGLAKPRTLQLVPGMSETIIAHAWAGFPDEVCGILAGRRGQAIALYRGRNVSSTPRVAYELDLDTLALQIGFANDDMEMIGIYHSHPTGPETPSTTDIEQSYYPDAVYLICSLADQFRPTLRAFRIVNGGFFEVQLIAP